jgi:mannose-6-phosphate isomerase-like protein (cupin superfamily)
MNTVVDKPLMATSSAPGTLSLFGNTLTFLARGEDTQGAWSLLLYTAVPRFPGPPLHWHDHTTERFYVLSGTLTFYLHGERSKASAGSFVLVPPGVVHKFANETDEPVSFLMYLSPSGFEDYFNELAQLIATEPIWPPTDISKVERLTAKYDQHPPLEP